jgi:hypothetical protein
MESKFSRRVKLFLLYRPHTILLATLLILGLAYADYMVIRDFFTGTNIAPGRQNLYGLLFALCLEGSAFFAGMSLAKWMDTTKYKGNENRYACVGFFISIFALLATFAVIIIFRWIMILGEGGMEAFMDRSAVAVGEWAAFGAGAEFYEEFPMDFFLTFMPIVTSLIAMLASWFAFRRDNDKRLEFEVAVLENRYLELHNDFMDDKSKLQDECTNLWTDITNHKIMPKRLSEFRNACLSRIKSKLIENALIQFPREINRYNKAVEVELEICMLKLMDYVKEEQGNSTCDTFNIDDILEGFSESRLHSEDKWDNEAAQYETEAKLSHLLDNNIKTAQIKTKYRYPLESREKRRSEEND